MKTTTMPAAENMTRKQIVAWYAPLLRRAEKAWDTEEVARLLVERNALLFPV